MQVLLAFSSFSFLFFLAIAITKGKTQQDTTVAWRFAAASLYGITFAGTSLFVTSQLVRPLHLDGAVAQELIFEQLGAVSPLFNLATGIILVQVIPLMALALLVAGIDSLRKPSLKVWTMVGVLLMGFFHGWLTSSFDVYQDRPHSEKSVMTELTADHVLPALTYCSRLRQLSSNGDWVCMDEDNLVEISAQTYSSMRALAQHTADLLAAKSCYGMPGVLISPIFCEGSIRRQSLAELVFNYDPALRAAFGSCKTVWSKTGIQHTAIASGAVFEAPKDFTTVVRFTAPANLDCEKTGPVSRKVAHKAILLRQPVGRD